LDNKKYNSALIVMSKGKSYKFEIHLLDINSDLYGKYLEVDLFQKVSEIESYDSVEELLEKIKHDIGMVREVFAEHG
jgi:FAD synthase